MMREEIQIQGKNGAANLQVKPKGRQPYQKTHDNSETQSQQSRQGAAIVKQQQKREAQNKYHSQDQIGLAQNLKQKRKPLDLDRMMENLDQLSQNPSYFEEQDIISYSQQNLPAQDSYSQSQTYSNVTSHLNSKNHNYSQTSAYRKQKYLPHKTAEQRNQEVRNNTLSFLQSQSQVTQSQRQQQQLNSLLQTTYSLDTQNLNEFQKRMKFLSTFQIGKKRVQLNEDQGKCAKQILSSKKKDLLEDLEGGVEMSEDQEFLMDFQTKHIQDKQAQYENLNALGRVSEEFSGGMDDDSAYDKRKAIDQEQDDDDQYNESAFEDQDLKERIMKRKKKEEEKYARENSLTDLFFN